jgi:hypothetical protein
MPPKKGTQRKKATGKKASRKNPTRYQVIKSWCAFNPYPMAKKDAVNMAQMKADKTVVELSERDIARLLADHGLEGETALKGKLAALTLDLAFKGDFYDTLDNNELWLLSCMYNKDMKKIKEHILANQAQSLVASIAKGFIDVNDI